MTKDEALNIAIDYMNERLEEHDAKFQRHPATEAERNNILADIEAVKEALAQPEQEPVKMYDGRLTRYHDGSIGIGTPPQRPSRSDIKPLTDEEIEDIWADCPADWDDKINVLTLARAIEAAHGIKGEV